MKKTWHINNSEYYLREVTSEVFPLPNGVYNIESTPLGQLYLKKMSEQFTFDFKVYGLERQFIDKVIKTYRNTKGNLGMLLNGLKGTGKTITAEILANELELPIILVNSNFPGLNNYLVDINQDVTILIDEYEKVFKGSISENDYDYDNSSSGNPKTDGDSTLLGIMDGTYKTDYRKVFILTTNRTWINDNMLSRPGRVRYLKQFSDLGAIQIEEIIADCLKDKKYKESVVNFLKPLKIITVDIVKTVISEVNIFNQSAEECCKDLNLEFKEDEYSFYKIIGKKLELIESGVSGRSVQHLFSKSRRWQGTSFTGNDSHYYLADAPNYKDNIYTVNFDGYQDPKYKDNFKIKIKKESAIHKSFIGTF